jgi:hypothetical protein
LFIEGVDVILPIGPDAWRWLSFAPPWFVVIVVLKIFGLGYLTATEGAEARIITAFRHGYFLF